MSALWAAIAIADGFLVLVGLVVVAIGARVWADAIAAAHRARAHAVEANNTEWTTGHAHDAIDDQAQSRIQAVAPTDEELEEIILSERYARNGHAEEYTTLGNEGIEEEPPIPPGGLYRV